MASSEQIKYEEKFPYSVTHLIKLQNNDAFHFSKQIKWNL